MIYGFLIAYIYISLQWGLRRVVCEELKNSSGERREAGKVSFVLHPECFVSHR